MAKDSYWFKHDSTAGRGLRMRKMAHIYGHWGKGVYWDVIEILRDQSAYSFDCEISSLQMLCDLIGCKDEPKFLSWYKDCVKLELFKEEDGMFFSEILCQNMEKWEQLKQNGSKGGRPQKPKRNQIDKQNETIIEEDSIVYNKIEENIIKEKKAFAPPSLLEIKEYCIERKNNVSPEKFFDHYTSNGWMVGRNKMKDWRAAVRNWEKSSFDKPASHNRNNTIATKEQLLNEKL